MGCGTIAAGPHTSAQVKLISKVTAGWFSIVCRRVVCKLNKEGKSYVTKASMSFKWLVKFISRQS